MVVVVNPRWSFDHPLFTPLLRKGFPPQCYGNGTQHWTEEINNSILVTHTHSRREEDTAPCRATRELNLKAGGTAEAVGGKLCSSRRRRWSPWEDVMGLLNRSVGWQGTEAATQRWAGPMPGPHEKMVEQRRREACC